VARLAIVTRPGQAGERLAEELLRRGGDALWWPAFTIGPAPDEFRARSVLARVAEHDLVIFVSPAAVHAAAPLLQDWPTATAIGAVGHATAQAIAELIPVPTGTPIVAPSAGSGAGSEAFFDAWQRSGSTANRVLILRAQAGREWLARRFADAGAEVEVLPVYSRTDSVPDVASLGRVARATHQGDDVTILFSSSEAIDALDRQLDTVAGAAQWLRRGRALATHPRIAEQLLAAGYTRVELAESGHEALVAQL